jgi:hypothetical protein
MHELANDINGDPVEVPEAARFWRLRRHLGGRGASVVVTNEDNAAVMLPIGASYAEFHDAVRGAAGKYTLYPCDGDGRPMKGAAVAHVFISEGPRNSNVAAQPGGDALTQLIGLLRETVDANTAMCKEVIGKYAGTLTSNAELIRAVDGAGVPARQAPATADLEDDEEDDGDEYEPTLAEIAMKQASDAFLLWLKLRSDGKEPAPISPEPETKAQPASAKPSGKAAAKSARPEPEPPKASTSAPTPTQMTHLLVVKSKLEPREARVVEGAIAKMPADERSQWVAELCARSVDDAVALVRDVIEKTKAAETKGDAP